MRQSVRCEFLDIHDEAHVERIRTRRTTPRLVEAHGVHHVFEVVRVDAEQRDPHSKSSMPVEPVISCTMRPANVRPLLPWSSSASRRSSNGNVNQLAWLASCSSGRSTTPACPGRRQRGYSRGLQHLGRACPSRIAHLGELTKLSTTSRPAAAARLHGRSSREVRVQRHERRVALVAEHRRRSRPGSRPRAQLRRGDDGLGLEHRRGLAEQVQHTPSAVDGRIGSAHHGRGNPGRSGSPPMHSGASTRSAVSTDEPDEPIPAVRAVSTGGRSARSQRRATRSRPPTPSGPSRSWPAANEQPQAVAGSRPSSRSGRPPCRPRCGGRRPRAR